MSCLRLAGQVAAPIILHDHRAEPFARSLQAVLRLGMNTQLAAYVGVCGASGAWASSGGIPLEKRRVIANAIHLDPHDNDDAGERMIARRRLSLGNSDWVVLVVAGIRPEKGIDVLLAALESMEEKRRPFVLIAGGSRDAEYTEACKRRVAGSELEQHVRFLGERRDIRTLVRAADLGVIPSRQESGPVVLIEYLAAALPVVYTSVGGVAERAAKEGVPGCVRPDAPMELASALRQASEMSEQQRRHRTGIGLEVAHRCFDIAVTVREWDEVYRFATKLP
jgi:glycosyltransferase involved in cell wall biosynthesis